MLNKDKANGGNGPRSEGQHIGREHMGSAAKRARRAPESTMGQRIKELRAAMDMSQEELAAKCRVTKGAVSQWETGASENIRLKTFKLLLAALETTFDALVIDPPRKN